ncbi:MAG: HD-GYP domain-containing protein, partial [bacterium]
MISKEAVNISPDELIPESEIFPLLYSIVNTKLDSMANLESFLQLLVDVGAKIVSARNSSLVIFAEDINILMSESKKPAKKNPFPFRTIYKSESHITIPLVLKEMKEPFGYLRVEGKLEGEKFDSKDLCLLLLLSRQATLKIENDLLHKRIHNNFFDALESLVHSLEAKYKYMHSHSRKVTQMALSIADIFSLEPREKEALRIAGLLHDIGKVGIPDSILTKKEILTNDEFDTIKSHPLIGEDIIQSLDFLLIEKSIIRHHHERLDGSGYPSGPAKGADRWLADRVSSQRVRAKWSVLRAR